MQISNQRIRYNFSAGPARLPDEVRDDINQALVDFRGKGIGVGETSHRDPAIAELLEDTDELLRAYLGIPDNFTVFFCSGGATEQFAMAPLNILREGESADYIITGRWSQCAFDEAQRLADVACIWSGQRDSFRCLPGPLRTNRQAKFLHYTSNNTVHGTQFKAPPQGDPTLLVGDMTSDILQRSIEWQRHLLVYASTCKNIGFPGMSLVIVRNESLEECRDDIPKIWSYKTLAKACSLYSTPALVTLYSINSMLRWIASHGSLEYWSQACRSRANRFYEFLDGSYLFEPLIAPPFRSISNITFALRNRELSELFFSRAQAEGFYGLNGHRSVGDGRISLYLGTSDEQISDLLDLFQDFEAESLHANTAML